MDREYKAITTAQSFHFENLEEVSKTLAELTIEFDTVTIKEVTIKKGVLILFIGFENEDEDDD